MVDTGLAGADRFGSQGMVDILWGDSNNGGTGYP